MNHAGVPTLWRVAEGDTERFDVEARPVPARSETPGMHGRISHGNRESPRLSAGEGSADHTGQSKGIRQ